MNPERRFTFLVLRPLNDMVLWLWRLERRAEFLYRPQFDRWLRPRLFAMTQRLRNVMVIRHLASRPMQREGTQK
jgi:hypothetical protein